MALPPLTRTGIAPYLSPSPNKYIRESFTDSDIPKLFAPEGVLRRCNDAVFTVRMFWHHNETREITAIFIRMIFHDGSMIAWIMPNGWDKQHNMIWIRENSTILDSGFPRSMDGSFGDMQKPKSGDVEPVLNIVQISYPEEIAAFFDQDRDVLPESLRERIFPPAPQDPLPEPPNNTTYLYMGAALLLMIGIGILAKKHFSSSDWKRGE
jgi:hypothetical protein